MAYEGTCGTEEAMKSRLMTSVARASLAESKFYQAWNMGELPVEGLKRYAEEYGAFIAALPSAWETQDDKETAHEEEEHRELWEKFAESLGTQLGTAQIAEVKELIETSNRLFADKVMTLGALYAFEVQQPETSVSKLEGLRKHYTSLGASEEYFEIHSRNHHEAEKLLARMSALSPLDRERAYAACDQMCVALRRALDGIYHAVM